MDVPSATRANRIYTGRVIYRNVGDEDMVAPCFSLVGRNAELVREQRGDGLQRVQLVGDQRGYKILAVAIQRVDGEVHKLEQIALGGLEFSYFYSHFFTVYLLYLKPKASHPAYTTLLSHHSRASSPARMRFNLKKNQK